MASGSGILDPTLLTYATAPGAPMSLEALKRRRAVQLALASKGRPFPKNVGEGLTSLGEALGERRLDDQLNAAEKGYAGGRDADPAMTTLPKVSALDPAVNPATSELRNRLAAYYAGGPGGATPNPTLAAGDTSPQATSASGDPSDDPRAAAIGGIETGGQKDPYRTVGVPTKYGPALGKYGVVAANVPKWTAAALGQPLTPQQYLADPAAQDAVFKHRFGQYVNQFGEEGAARAWFGGPGNVNNPGVTDAHGRLTVGTYGQDYLRRLQGAKRSGAVYPSGSMTGASLTTDAAPVLADENPTTPTDIAAAPAPMLVASGASEGDDRGGSTTIDTATGADPAPPAARTMPGIRPPPATAHGVRVTGDTLPSSTAIPPPSEQTMPDPGPEPKPPPRIEFSPRQQMALEVMNSRNSSEHGKAFAKQQFDIEEKIRTELMQRRETDYAHQRQRWEKLTDEKNKFEREAEDRKTEQLVKRLGAEKTQAELEKMYFERGEPRDVALEKARRDVTQAGLNIAKAEREAGTWDEKVIDGTIYRARPATATTPQGPWEVAPGSPKKENLTETQAKTVKFMQRAVVASSQLGDASVLAGLVDTAKGKLPIGGNYWVSPEYQKAQNAAFTWAQSVLRDESGAVLSPSEIANKMKAYFPQPGDNEQTIRDKAFRRKTEEETFYHALGDRKKVIDDWREERKGRRVPVTDAGRPTVPEGTLRINNRTGVRQRVMGGHW